MVAFLVEQNRNNNKIQYLFSYTVSIYGSSNQFLNARVYICRLLQKQQI